ncbi:Fur-regulated basic protein FbpA [Sporolactobacillus nakayamae]|uniref:Fur-regulated basic protein A n=1 Tax=Sporolactobacillus nakayamae TaxID=269670 RepID=A0A1I2R9T3_9BACL|nr:Fur-regulated basic protein FbpA [Sporolactobacillus nakayamae]SFG37220.1 Fur-regulated basic protein A [Sporolactobacillus nakayamae]
MTDTLTKGYEKKKNDLIGKLLDLGIFKTKNRQLYELSLNELEDTYRQLLQGS